MSELAGMGAPITCPAERRTTANTGNCNCVEGMRRAAEAEAEVLKAEAGAGFCARAAVERTLAKERGPRAACRRGGRGYGGGGVRVRR